MRRKGYIITCTCKKTGVVKGYVEHSFSMGWSEDYVRVFWNHYELKHGYKVWSHMSDDECKKKSVTYFKKQILDCVKEMRKDKRYKDYNINFYRIKSKNCPFAIDMCKGNDKFTRRNKLFKRRECAVK